MGAEAAAIREGTPWASAVEEAVLLSSGAGTLTSLS